MSKSGTSPVENKPLAKKKHKAPKSHPTFVKMWNVYIEEISTRTNFKKGHLYQLEILCDLFVELEQLNDVIDISGHSYESEGGRGGGTISRIRPEVSQRNKVISEIRNYSKMLGLLLVKDTDFSNDEPEDEEWE